MKPIDNITCFASAKKCSALKVDNCNGCTFYKTREQIETEHKASVKRLANMGLLEPTRQKYNTGS